jgi:hypothetical protein
MTGLNWAEADEQRRTVADPSSAQASGTRSDVILRFEAYPSFVKEFGKEDSTLILAPFLSKNLDHLNAQYTATQLSNDKPVNPAVALVDGLIGGAVAVGGNLIPGESNVGDFAARWMAIANNPATRPSLSNASRMAIGGLEVHGIEQVSRSGASNIITSHWERKLD